MTFDNIVSDLDHRGLNMIDFALYTPEKGIMEHRFRPSSNCSNNYSISKAFLMTAVGILQDE